MRAPIVAPLLFGALLAVPTNRGFAQQDATVAATASLVDSLGRPAGTAKLTRDRSGRMVVTLEVTGLSAGEHGVHLHGVGRCDRPAFATAGGHFNPAAKSHGLANPAGPHGGDLPNVGVGPDGTGKLSSTLPPGVDLKGLLDDDGAAVVVHGGRDDQMTDPSGNSGPRVACGVLVRKSP